MELLKGGPIAKKLTEELKTRVEGLPFQPCLAFVRVGENKSDLSYEGAAMRRLEKIGAAYREVVFPEDVPEETLKQALTVLNQDPSVHGILLFRPLPRSIHEKNIVNLISYEKDLDAMSRDSLARVFCQEEGFAPCTAEAVVTMLKEAGISLSGRHAVIIGRSLVIGKPLSMLLLKENATVTVCHSRSQELQKLCREGDILVACLGHAHFVTGDFVKEGAVLVDVGINVAPDGSILGDIDPESVGEKASLLTPVPGGVGSLTTCILADHLVRACEMQLS